MFVTFTIVCVIAFEDVLYVYGQVSQEVIDSGKQQYQVRYTVFLVYGKSL